MKTSEIIPFDYAGQQVRAITVKDEPWFVAKDVAKVLELGNVRSSIALLDEDEKGVHTIDTLGGEQEVSIISEAGLYSLILRSRKPEAKAFKRWVTHEVLPSIRKRGGYLTPEATEQALTDPDFIIRLATSLKEERARNRQLTAKVEEDKPKVLFADAVAKEAQSNSSPAGDSTLFVGGCQRASSARRKISLPVAPKAPAKLTTSLI